MRTCCGSVTCFSFWPRLIDSQEFLNSLTMYDKPSGPAEWEFRIGSGFVIPLNFYLLSVFFCLSQILELTSVPGKRANISNLLKDFTFSVLHFIMS